MLACLKWLVLRKPELMTAKNIKKKENEILSETSPCFSWESFLVVLSFLTLIPISQKTKLEFKLLARSLHYFPIVGLIIGGIALLAGQLSLSLFGSPLHAVIAITTTTIVSAGLHLDGLADTCDALFSWRDRESRLRIMKDSRIGTMGALALILVLFIKIAALVSLEKWWLGCLLAPMFGRIMNVYGAVWFKAASDNGLSHDIKVNLSTKSFFIGMGLSTIIGALTIGLLIIPLLGILITFTHLMAKSMEKQFNGLTGDTYGLLSELNEVLVLLFLVANLS